LELCWFLLGEQTDWAFERITGNEINKRYVLYMEGDWRKFGITLTHIIEVY